MDWLLHLVVVHKPCLPSTRQSHAQPYLGLASVLWSMALPTENNGNDIRIYLECRHKPRQFKVVVTPWTHFCLCNIWVISRRNAIYLYNKKPHLDRLFDFQTFRYDVIRGILPLLDKRKLICIASNYVISKSLRVKSLSRWGFLLQRYITFLHEITQILHRQTFV